MSGRRGGVGTDTKPHTAFLVAAVELSDCVHGRGKVKVRAVPRLQSRSVVSLGTGEDKRQQGEKLGWLSGFLETHKVSALTKCHETHTYVLLHSLSIRTTVLKDAPKLCSLCCCRGNLGKHAAVKSHFSSFPSCSGQSWFCCCCWLLF